MIAGLAAWSGLHAQPAVDAVPTVAPATEQPVFEEWILIVFDGKTCGFGNTVATVRPTDTGPQYTTVHQEEFVVKRNLISLKIMSTTRIVEDQEGGVLSFTQRTKGAGSDIESSGVRQGEELVVSSRGQTQRFKIPRLAALGPEAIRRRTESIPLLPGQPFSLNTFSCDYPQGIVVESGKVVGQEMRNVRGVERKLWKQTSETNLIPGLIATSWVDDHGKDVEAFIVMPGIGDLHEYVSTRAECMKQPEGIEIFNASLIRPQRAITPLEKLGAADYRITAVDLNKNLNLWNEGEQHIIASSPGTADVEVVARSYSPSDATWTLPHADTPELHSYLQASSYLESDTPQIKALAKQAVGDEKNPVLAARKIEKFVRNYIVRKDLSIGFASAQETATSREGDCTEHAVLCAAIGRAAGLPTRCVIGLGYAPPGESVQALANTVDTKTGIFAFHMWAEAWIGPNQWMPMDAALNGFDVGHIALLKTALEEVNPMTDLNTPILQLMTNLKVEVLKTVLKSDMVPVMAPVTPAPTSSSIAKPIPSSAPSATPAPKKPASEDEPVRAGGPPRGID